MLKSMLVATVALSSAAFAHAGLNIGDKAPALGADATWIQGESVTDFVPGQIYVLDFWATWCGPCVKAIPHMDELADKHRSDGVTVIGVAIWPRDRMTPTAEFVQQRGDAMSYTIAADVDGKCAKKFMEAVGAEGIPTVMIVDRAGRLAWIGHPMEGMDEALGQIIAGTYDLAGAAARHASKGQSQALAAPLIAELKAAKQASDWPRFIGAADKLVALDSDTYGNLTIEKFRIMLDEMDTPAKAFAYAGEMINGPWSKHAMALNAFAWTVVESGTPDLDWNMALGAAQKASSLTGDKEPNILDTLAAVHFKRGEVANAIEAQKNALSLLPAGDAAEFRQRLAEYEKAAGAAH